MNIQDFCVGKEVIVRTFSAGVWFGILEERDGKVVLLRSARRMWRWWCKESISLSGIVVYGINQDKSKIAPAVPYLLLTEVIECIPIEGAAAKSIRTAPIVKQE